MQIGDLVWAMAPAPWIAKWSHGVLVESPPGADGDRAYVNWIFNPLTDEGRHLPRVRSILFEHIEKMLMLSGPMKSLLLILMVKHHGQIYDHGLIGATRERLDTLQRRGYVRIEHTPNGRLWKVNAYQGEWEDL